MVCVLATQSQIVGLFLELKSGKTSKNLDADGGSETSGQLFVYFSIKDCFWDFVWVSAWETEIRKSNY